MAPEIMDPEKFGLHHSHVSLEADIYALAVVMWEVSVHLHLKTLRFRLYALDRSSKDDRRGHG